MGPVPELSVLIPLEDARGEAGEHLRTWLQEQSLSRQRYQVVLAGTGEDPEGEALVEDMLGPGDALIRVPGAGLIELWNAAAERADADWLLLTENHCEGDPACLAAVLRAIDERPEHDAFTLEHGHITVSATGELNARWFDEIYDEWTQPGEWARLNLVGFAIHRRAWKEGGGLDPRYGLFSAPLLSARLDQQGARIGHVADARVLHVHPDDIAEHHHYSVEYARGECEARLREDPFLCDRYFGPAGPWRNRLLLEPATARQAVRVLGSSAARALVRRRPELPWLARELAARAPAALAGARPYALRDRFLFVLNERAAKQLPLAPEARWRAFLRAQDRIVQHSMLTSAERHLSPPAAPVPWEGDRPVESLDDMTLSGVHGLEAKGERWFRWTHPLAVIRVSHSGQADLRIDTGGVRPSPLSYVRGAYADGRRLDPQSLREEGDVLVVPLPEAEADGAPTAVTLLSRPLEPARSGSSDPRRLGVPIFSLGLESCARS